MMLIAKIRRGTITIPVEICKEAHLKDGTVISVEYKPEDGVIILKPETSMDGEEYVMLSPRGKTMIEEALEAEQAGDVIGPFSNIDEAVKALEES